MNRRQEEVRDETLKNLGREKMLESNMNREQRLEDKRFLRQQMTEQKEREMEETMLKVQCCLLIIFANSLDPEDQAQQMSWVQTFRHSDCII